MWLGEEVERGATEEEVMKAANAGHQAPSCRLCPVREGAVTIYEPCVYSFHVLVWRWAGAQAPLANPQRFIADFSSFCAPV